MDSQGQQRPVDRCLPKLQTLLYQSNTGLAAALFWFVDRRTGKKEQER
jgi:hypothetical protein